MDSDGDESKAELNITIDGNSRPDITPDDRPDPYPEHKHDGAIGVKADSIIVDEASWAAAQGNNVLKDGAGHQDHVYKGYGGFNVDLHGEGGDITLQYGDDSVTLHVDGQTVTVTKNGQDLVGDEGLTVNGVTVNHFNAAVGADGKVHVTYDYTLDGAKTHGTPNAIDENDTLDGQITVHVVDGQGHDTADGYIDVQVHDDGPWVKAGTLPNEQDPDTVLTGTLEMHFGADGLTYESNSSPALTVVVDGESYSGEFNINDKTCTFEILGKGKLTIEAENLVNGYDGSELPFKFEPDASSTESSLDFTFVVEDGDGDTASQDVHLKWSAPTPKIEGLESLATDDSYVAASEEGETVQPAGTMYGKNPDLTTDNNGKAATSESKTFTVETNGQECTLEITGGTGTEQDTLTVTFNEDGSIKSWRHGNTGGNTWPEDGVTVHGQYGDLTITQYTKGSFEYTYTQKKNVDHSHEDGETNNPDESKDAAESFGVTLSYGEDNKTAFGGSINVSIDDDEPIADDDLRFNKKGESVTQPDIAEPGQTDTPDSQTDIPPAAVYDDEENGVKVEHPNDHKGNVTLTGKVEGLNFGADGVQSVDIVIDGRTFHGEPNSQKPNEWTWEETTESADPSVAPGITFNPETGTFSVTLPASEVEQFSHVDENGNSMYETDEDGQIIDEDKRIEDHAIHFTVTVTDGDGDTATAEGDLYPPKADNEHFNMDTDAHTDFHVHVQTGDTLVHVNGTANPKDGEVDVHSGRINGKDDISGHLLTDVNEFQSEQYDLYVNGVKGTCDSNGVWTFDLPEGTLTMKHESDDAGYKFDFESNYDLRHDGKSHRLDLNCTVKSKNGQFVDCGSDASDSVKWAGEGVTWGGDAFRRGDLHLMEANGYAEGFDKFKEYIYDKDGRTDQVEHNYDGAKPGSSEKQDPDVFFGRFFTDSNGNSLTHDEVFNEHSRNVVDFDIDGVRSDELRNALEAAAKEARASGSILHVYSSQNHDLELDSSLDFSDDNSNGDGAYNKDLVVVFDCGITLTGEGSDLRVEGFLYVGSDVNVDDDLVVSGGLAVNGNLTYGGKLNAYWSADENGLLGDLNVGLNGFTVTFEELLKNDSDPDSENGLHIVDKSITWTEDVERDWDIDVDYENGTVTLTPKPDHLPHTHPKFSYTVEDEHGLRDDTDVTFDAYNRVDGDGGTISNPVEGSGVHDLITSNSDGDPEVHKEIHDYNIGIVLDASSSMLPEKQTGDIKGPLGWEGNNPFDKEHVGYDHDTDKVTDSDAIKKAEELHVEFGGRPYYWEGEVHSDGRLVFWENADGTGNRVTLYDDNKDGLFEKWELKPAPGTEHTVTGDLELWQGENGAHETYPATWLDRTAILKDAIQHLLEQLAEYPGDIHLYVGQFNSTAETLWTGTLEELKQALEEDTNGLLDFLEKYANAEGTHYNEGFGSVLDWFTSTEGNEKYTEPPLHGDGVENHVYFLTDGSPNSGEWVEKGKDKEWKDRPEFKGEDQWKGLGEAGVEVHAVGVGGDISKDKLDKYDSDRDAIIVADKGDLEAALDSITESIIDFIPTADVVVGGEGNDVIFGDAIGDLYEKLNAMVTGDGLSKEEEGKGHFLTKEDRDSWEALLEAAGGWNAVLAAQFISEHPDWLDRSYDSYTYKNAKGDTTEYAHDKGDVLFGGSGDDIVYGQGGNDILFGDGTLGNSEDHYGTLGRLADLLGEARSDSTPLSVEDLIDKLNGDPNTTIGTDNKWGQGAASGLDKENLSDLAEALEGKNGQGGIESDTDGDDLLYGGNGDDLLLGGGGNDYLNGGDGEDTLFGGSGDDLIVYDSSDYAVFGGSGIDILLSNDEDKRDPSLDDLLDNNVGGDQPHVEGVEVFLKGSGKYNGEAFNVEDLTSLSDLAKKAGIVVEGDQLTLKGKWNHEDGTDIYTKDGLTVELHGMTPAGGVQAQPEDAENEQLVFQLQNTQS